jgi:type II secretory pathway pseudopilin PulG
MCHSVRRTTGLTLIEMTLVVATIALLVGLALPAVRAMVNSFQSEGGTKSIIHAALNSARTMALTHQRYIGVRFQKACRSNDPADPLQGLLDAPQYMVFIVHEEPKVLNLAEGFRALEGHEPIRLPDTIGVMDLTKVKSDMEIDEPRELSDATTFSIVFSPSGKLVIQEVRVRNRDGHVDSASDVNVSADDIFNKKAQVDVGVGVFYQDDYFGDTWSAYPNLGLGPESSCTSFVLYDRHAFRLAYAKKKGWTECLGRLIAGAVYVSPYTGDLISSP